MFKITLNIDGMMCGMCEAHINDTVRKNFKVKKVSSSHSKGKTEIIAFEEIPEQALTAAIAETGYKVIGYDCEPYKKKGLFG